MLAHTQDENFQFVPEFYLETAVDAFHSLRRADPPLLFAQGRFD